MVVGGSGNNEDMGRGGLGKVVNFVMSLVMRKEWDEELYQYNPLLLREVATS